MSVLGKPMSVLGKAMSVMGKTPYKGIRVMSSDFQYAHAQNERKNKAKVYTT